MSNVSEKGGAAAAAAALEALLRSAVAVTGSRAGWGEAAGAARTVPLPTADP